MSNDDLSETTNTDPEESPTDFNLSIRMPRELIDLADSAGKRLMLKRADVIRLSLARGIVTLIEQLELRDADTTTLEA